MEVMEDMNNGEIIKNSVSDFMKTQRRMALAREENAERTYADLKEDYVALKVILTSLSVNLTEIDYIKE